MHDSVYTQQGALERISITHVCIDHLYMSCQIIWQNLRDVYLWTEVIENANLGALT
jgi:hypothetical protein